MSSQRWSMLNPRESKFVSMDAAKMKRLIIVANVK